MGPSTNPAKLGDLTVSVLRGEEGYQKKEVEELASWLGREVRPDVVHLTNILLVGLARTLRQRLDAPVVCGLQAEDSFLDLLTAPHREEALRQIRERGQEIDGLVSVSRYYADFAADYFGLPREKMTVIPPGIVLDGYEPIPCRDGPDLTVGYLGRIAPEKGVHHLCEAYSQLAQNSRFSGLRLKVAGFLAREEMGYASRLRKDLMHVGVADRVEFIGTVERDEKLSFLRDLDLLVLPSIYPDPKGMSALEALASGIPVVAPRHGAFPELAEATGGLVLYDPEDVVSLVEALQQTITDKGRRARLGSIGRQSVLEKFNAERMARQALDLYRSLTAGKSTRSKTTP
jgi:glycosyltransferase involved in cell wall biosynthesis